MIQFSIYISSPSDFERLSTFHLTNSTFNEFDLLYHRVGSLFHSTKFIAMGGTSPSTSLMPQLVQAVIPPQHDAFVDSKGSVNILRGLATFHSTSLHIRRDASAGIDPPAGLLQFIAYILDRV